MADAFLDVTEPLDSTQKKVLLIDNLDGTYSIASASKNAQAVKIDMEIATGTLGALNATVEMDCDCAQGSVVFEVSGTWTGKIVVEGAVNGTYNNLSIVQPLGGITQNGIQNDNQNGVYRVLIMAGYTKVRLRMSQYTSGSASITMNAAPLVATSYVWQLNAANLQTTATLSATDNAVLDDIAANQTDGTQIAGVKLFDVGSSTYIGLKFLDGKPRVSDMPYLYDITEGNVTGHTPFTKLGYNGDVGATEEDIITQGGVYPWIAAGGIALDVVSSNVNDTLAGTGIQKVKITYLDTDYSLQTQTIDMNGTTPVPLTDTSILRVNSIRAVQVGTGGVAAGDITVENVGGSTIYRQISAGYTRGRGLTYTVPLGKTLYITSVAVSSGYTTAGKVVRWIGRAQVDDTDPTTKINFFQPFFEIITQDASFVRCFEMPIKIPATADLKVSAVSNGAGSFCNCALRGWLE